jgi:hypothetical protein
MFPVEDVAEVGGSGKSAKWVNARKKLIAAGFTIRQNGDAEGTALFNPEDVSAGLKGIHFRRFEGEPRGPAANSRQTRTLTAA